MKQFPFVLILFLATLLAGSCTREITDPNNVTVTDISKTNLSGLWNGYRYSGLNGPVALEIIKIERSATNSKYYTATKITGDNAVPAGNVTWEGEFRSNPFKVSVTVGNGINLGLSTDSIMVLDANNLKLSYFGSIYTRRIDGYFP